MTSIFYTRINLHLQKQIIHLWNMRGLVRSAIRIRNQAKWHQNQIKINQKLWSFSSVHRACSPQTWLNVSVHRLKHTDRGNAISRIVSYRISIKRPIGEYTIYDCFPLAPTTLFRWFIASSRDDVWSRDEMRKINFYDIHLVELIINYTHSHTHIRWIWMSDEAVNIQMYVEKLLYL